MYIDNLSGIVDSYDLLIVDVYGVIFDGTTLIPEAFATIASLIKAKKNLFLLSNSPRPQYVTREKIVSCMHKIGKTNQNINGLEIFTSGDMFAEFMASSISDKGKRIASPVHASSSARTNIWNASSVKNDFSFIKGRLYLLGATPEHHLIREINQRLHAYGSPDLSITTVIADADYAIILGASNASEPGVTEKFNQELELMAKAKLPVLCPNPDISAPGGSKSRVFTPGFYAQKYQAMGVSEVYYFGKPFNAVYDFAISKYAAIKGLDPIALKNGKILCIGDSIIHDVCGAYNIGADALLIDGNFSLQAADFPGLADYPPHYQMAALRL